MGSENRLRWFYVLLLFIAAAAAISQLSETWTDAHVIWLATATVGAALLWLGMLFFAFFQIIGMGVRSRLPDVELVRALADAYNAVVGGGTSDFRSFTRRREISAHLRKAAGLLEGPMVRILAGGDRVAETVVRPHLEAAAAGLRQKLAWLAIPRNDTREDLARALGEALIAAATGHLARLTSGEPVAPTAVRWQDRLLAVAHWCAGALGPAAGLWLAWPLIPDAATQALAAQFAALCFVVATFSVFDPTARDKLNSVVNTGAALFNWGKPKA